MEEGSVDETTAFTGAENEKTEDKVSWRTQVYLFLNISGPNMVCNILSQTQWLISSSFAGRELGPNELGAISLTILAALVVRSFMIGIYSGYGTLAGNAFGEKNYKKVGFLFETTLVLCVSISLPMALFYMHSRVFLDILGQPKEIVVIASDYLRTFILFFPAETFYELLVRFYQIQNVTKPFVFIKAFATLFHYFAVHSLRDVMKALVLTQWLSLFLATQIFRLKAHIPETWPTWEFSRSLSAKYLLNILRLGIPGVLALSEWWFYEFQTVLVGTISATALTAHAVAYFIIPFYFVIPYAMATAAQTRIAVLMGERRYHLCKKIGKGTLAINICLGFISASSALFFKNNIFSLFIKDDQAVLFLTNRIWPIVSVYLVLDTVLASAMGIFRGLGRHALLAKIIAICLWIIGVPLELFILRVLKLGLHGLWVGMFSIYVLMSCSFIFNLCGNSIYQPPKYLPISEEGELDESGGEMEL